MRIMSFKASNIAFIPVTEEIARAAGAIALSTPRTPLADVMITATALVHAGGAVVTDDEQILWRRPLRVQIPPPLQFLSKGQAVPSTALADQDGDGSLVPVPSTVPFPVLARRFSINAGTDGHP